MLKTTRNQASMKYLWKGEFMAEQKNLITIVQKMMEQGWTYLSSASGPEAKKLAEATKIAREKKLGIFGTSCTQTVNLKNAKCDIKGNQTSNGLGKFYHYPGCGHYEETDVQLYRGEQWFCTKSEAEKAFRPY